MTAGTGVIQGVIKDDSGLAVSAAYPAAVNPSLGGKQYTALTTSTGSFSISGVVPANWGFPIWGYPSGYGMMQIDPPPSQTLLWNWQADVQQAGTKLGNTQGPAFWNSQVMQFNACNQNLAKAGQPPVPPPPNQQEGACTFTLPTSAGAGVPGSIAGGGATNTYWFADQIEYVASDLNQGMPVNLYEPLGMLVLNRSSLILEKKIEEVLKSPHPLRH